MTKDKSFWYNWERGDQVRVLYENDDNIPVGTVVTVRMVEDSDYTGVMRVCVDYKDVVGAWPIPIDENGDAVAVLPFEFVSSPISYTTVPTGLLGRICAERHIAEIMDTARYAAILELAEILKGEKNDTNL